MPFISRKLLISKRPKTPSRRQKADLFIQGAILAHFSNGSELDAPFVPGKLEHSRTRIVGPRTGDANEELVTRLLSLSAASRPSRPRQLTISSRKPNFPRLREKERKARLKSELLLRELEEMAGQFAEGERDNLCLFFITARASQLIRLPPFPQSGCLKRCGKLHRLTQRLKKRVVGGTY